MNEEKHWNTIGPKYEDEIFDVFQSDRGKILPRYFAKYANPLHTVIDFGCGVGKAFPFLSPLFSGVLGIDISAALLLQARRRNFANVEYKRADLTQTGFRVPQADFVFCCNVIMLTQQRQNEAMIRNLQKSLKRGGHAVVVVPSMESILYSTFRLMEWYRREGVLPKEIPSDDMSYYRGSKLDVIQGLVKINGVTTKHYLQSELEVLFTNAGLDVMAIEKVEYDWTTEFSAPPKWLGRPYPWDWVVESQKP